MTDDRADVIEQAVKVLRDQHISHVTPISTRIFARALSAAGLLSSPADQDEQHVDLTPVAAIIRDAQAYRGDTGIVFKPESAASDLFSAGLLAGRSERLARDRAEAEVERLQAERDLLRAQVAAVRAELDREEARPILRTVMFNGEPFPLIIEVDTIRAALDTAGGGEDE